MKEYQKFSPTDKKCLKAKSTKQFSSFFHLPGALKKNADYFLATVG
jgi:hypothetical protein